MAKIKYVKPMEESILSIEKSEQKKDGVSINIWVRFSRSFKRSKHKPDFKDCSDDCITEEDKWKF